MAYDKGLAQRIREMLEEEPGYAEKKMFGGLCFLLFGNMACGIIQEDLIVRVGAYNYEKALTDPHARKFDLTGKALKGWVMISGEVLDDDDVLRDWMQTALVFVASLPPK